MLTMLLYVTLGLALVLAARKPARRLFGAGPAFTLWLLPLLLAMLPWLPALPSGWIVAPALPVLSATPATIAAVAPVTFPAHWLLPLWLAGTLCCLLRLTIHYSQLLRQCHPLPDSMRHMLPGIPHASDRLRLHPAGPAVLWAPRSLVLLPADFLERFDADEQRLVLQHEFMHLRRGDALWSLLAEFAMALLWFHPLAWLALPRLRLDQELACDERVLLQSPQDEAKYAHTLLHSTGMDATPVLIPWLAQPQLKERLSMIQRQRPGALRRRIGFIGLTLLMVGGACMAQAASQPDRVTATQNATFNSRIPPRYPQDAIQNKQEGTVILKVLVGADGTPREISVDPATQAAPSLIKAASDAAMQWHFNPAMKNGKPIESYAKVPVNFSLDPMPAAPSTPHAPAPATQPRSTNS
ncbi:M56 family metallopeptidase [Rhodanobacter sp. C01]|uniref:M56 family metallopeptidase n=1 Tax=Rhodanobacter sp. C01 TaxID=1945856 RepID=UPI000986AE87|nr:M56 family metallopeptidase [Rhodanobacter sp. C01]OOG50218.1 energy transducer TonB [Rhodanobacter sp. C01]